MKRLSTLALFIVLLLIISCSKKSNNPQPSQQNNNNNSSNTGCFYSFSQSVRPYTPLVSPDGIDSTNSVDSLLTPFPITLFGYTAKYIAYPISGMYLPINDSSYLEIDALDPFEAQNQKKYLSWKTWGTSPNRIFVTQIEETYPSEYNIQYSFFESTDSVTIQYGRNIGGFDGGAIGITYTNGYSIGYSTFVYGSLSNLKDTCFSVTTTAAYIALANDTTMVSLSVPQGATLPTGTTFTFKKIK